MDRRRPVSEQYKVIFLRYYDELVRHAYAILQNLEEAEDVVQETFFKVAKSHVLEREIENIGGYMHQAVHNNVRYWLRSKRRLQEAESAYKRESVEWQVEKDHQTTDLLTRVEQALVTLPRQQQLAFRLVYVDQMKYRDAAEKIGVSINTLKTNLKLAMRNIRHKLLIFLLFVHPFVEILHHIY